MDKKIILIFIILFLFLKNNKTEHFINARIAKTNQEIRQGLMNIKESLPENEGMIFLMPYRNIHSFWMKNTYIPLDSIVFIDKTKNKNYFKIIGYHKNKPLENFNGNG